MRLAASQTGERGDTIIEVIFAVAVFSFVAISSLTIMNQGIAISERSLEITLVRQQIDAQAEALRYIHEARVVATESESTPDTPAETWSRLVNVYGRPGASPYGELSDSGDCKLPGESYSPFILNARTAQIWDGELEAEYDGESSLPPYSQVVYNDDSSINAAYGVWVEAVPSSAVITKRFVDFHIRACWPAPGSAIPMTIGTIVRLYDPRT